MGIKTGDELIEWIERTYTTGPIGGRPHAEERWLDESKADEDAALEAWRQSQPDSVRHAGAYHDWRRAHGKKVWEGPVGKDMHPLPPGVARPPRNVRGHHVVHAYLGRSHGLGPVDKLRTTPFSRATGQQWDLVWQGAPDWRAYRFYYGGARKPKIMLVARGEEAVRGAIANAGRSGKLSAREWDYKKDRALKDIRAGKLTAGKPTAAPPATRSSAEQALGPLEAAKDALEKVEALAKGDGGAWGRDAAREVAAALAGIKKLADAARDAGKK